MTRELLRYPARTALYAMVFAGVVALLLELLIDSTVLFLVGSALIGVSFAGWGTAYLASAEWIGPVSAPRERRWVGYLFIVMGALTLGLLVVRVLIE